MPKIPTVPDWVYNPESKIKTVIVGFIVGLALDALATVRDAINTVFDTVSNAIEQAGTAVTDAFASAGSVVSAFDILQAMVFETAQALGPAGPVFVALVAIALLVLTVRLIRALMDSVPGLSGVETFFSR